MAFETISFDEFQANAANYLGMVKDKHNPIRIQYDNGEYVLVYPENFTMDETDYLMSTQANRSHLEEAINGKSEDRITYNSLEELKNEMGI